MPAAPECSSASSHWDAVVIGGGPGGSSAATTLARAGRRVLVLEKETFPRFHIGESLLPYNRQIFEDLGVWPKLEAAGFMRKRGAQFLMGSGAHRVRADFSKGSFNEYHESIHVERARFDEMLLNHARECGAEAREGCTVLSYRTEDARVAVTYRDALGHEVEVTAGFLIDASGLTNFTANRESLRRFYPRHRKVAIFGHFSNVVMPDGGERGDILIVRRRNSWFWLIPITDEVTSVGLVLGADDFREGGGEAAATFADAVATTPVVNERFSNAEPLGPLRAMSDFSYRNERLIGKRVVRVGDAAGFIDPIFSSGVILAMVGGRDAARGVDEALTTGETVTPALRAYERTTRRRIGQYWEFIENFYQPHFAQLFFQPYDRWRLVCAVNTVLAGSTRLPFGAWWRLRVFFLLAWLNRHVPVVPRIEVS